MLHSKLRWLLVSTQSLTTHQEGVVLILPDTHTWCYPHLKIILKYTSKSWKIFKNCLVNILGFVFKWKSFIWQWYKYFPNLLNGCLVMVGLSVMIFNIVWRMDEIVLRICQLAQNWQMKKDWTGVSECQQLKYSQTIWNNTNTTLIFSKSLSGC